MKLLLIHSDYFEYEAKKKAIKDAEEFNGAKAKDSMNEVLVAFCTVEKSDEEDVNSVVKRASQEISSVADQVGAKNIFVYPYAHLSPDLASSKVAIEALRRLEEELAKRGYNVKRAPFGWYKAFTLKCKGHPLSELSRSVSPEVIEEKEAPKEKKPSKYLILDVDGKEYELDLLNLDACSILENYPLLKQFIICEEIGRVPKESPPHIDLMRRLELVDYEPASDTGHFRFYPKGTMLKELLEKFADQIAHQIGAVRIETPMIYKLEGDIAEQASRFLEKDYRFKIGGRELVLRFAGDFGLFKMMSSAILSYKHLPLRVYELTPSFRYERSGECVGLRRLRAFTMPDVHCFCKDLKEGMDEYKWLLKHYTHLANSMEIEYVLAFRVVEQFYKENREWFRELVQIVGKPALIELLPEMKHYWVVKNEFQFIDSVKGNAQLCTVQLDIEDSERYGIYYVDEKGQKKGCIIVHSSMGSIERWIYALLEQAAKDIKRGIAPMLPVWLSPIQVRIIPISPDFLEESLRVSNELEKHEIRVDVDDRYETVSAKVRDAEREWIPYIVVVGKREIETGKLTVRVRREGLKEMSLEELVKEILNKTSDKPKIPFYLPKLLSKRPQFVGR